MAAPAQSGGCPIYGGAAKMCIADFDEYRVKYQLEV